MNLRRIPMVEVTGLEPAASWSQTTRATNCATPRSYNLSIIIHKRCGRQVPAWQKSYSQAEQPQHQQVRWVEGIEEPLVKRRPRAARGRCTGTGSQTRRQGSAQRSRRLPHLPAAQPGHAAVEQRRRANAAFCRVRFPPAQANSSVNTGASSAQSQNSDAQISSTMQTPRSTRSRIFSCTSSTRKQSSSVNSMLNCTNPAMPFAGKAS